MSSKRKRDDTRAADTVHRPQAGTRSFTSGKAVRDGLAVGSRQALVSLHQQILTPHSELPLPITHPTVLILQHYLDTSPTADEIFKAWHLAEETKNEKLAETAALLLALVLRILTPLPFFHTHVTGIVSKLVSPTEPYADLLGRLLQSGRREHILAGLSVAAAAVHVDSPDPANLVGAGARGRLAGKMWASLVDGGSAKGLGKMLSMRKRTKEGAVEYGDKDPLDRPDIRHLVIQLILPLLPTTAFHAHAKQILPHLYSGLALDPPTTVYRVLDAMWASMTAPPPGIARRISLVLLDESALDHISKLLTRGATEPTTGVEVSEMAAGFLEGVTCQPGRGICFTDEGWYPREEDEKRDDKKRLHNRILSNVVKRLGARVVDDEGRVGAWVLKMFEACPELVSGYWAHSALSLEPRLDARWIATMAYVGRVISLPLPDRSKFNQPAPQHASPADMPPRSVPPEVLAIVESVLPSPLTKTHLSKGLQHADALVQHVTALALARGLQKLQAVQELFADIAAQVDDEADGPWITRARELEIECRRRVPEVPVIIAFAQKAATLARPVDEDDDVDPALAARSAMLTEAALRLFGLYHKTLPSLAGEARFDIGKLLVSASSANAERRARREAREGSVVSDSGSVGSVGTLGTVGMGGGFGHSRGNVEGFEALSQLHVLRLLSQVRDWNWTKKAAGSQFTYLYHILQLHLSTENVVTHSMTTTLLHRLLQPSLLFDHDPLELPIWLDAMPKVSETVSGPMFVAQQIHLLSFVDECVRRALKTPHRYIEETDAVPGGEVYPASPLLLTMVEQLHAKLLGMHIATESAAVVLNYLRRVLVGLLGKQATHTFVRAIVDRITQTVQAAKDAGQPRHGLTEIIGLINSDLGVICENAAPINADPETPRLVDEADWIARSFTQHCIAGSFPVNAVSDDAEENARRAQFLVHLLAARADPAILRLLTALLDVESTPSAALRLKSSVFNSLAVRGLFLQGAGNAVRPELAALAGTLRTEVPLDHGMAEHYAAAVLESKDFAIVVPWVRFMAPAQVDDALKATIKRAKKGKGDATSAHALLSALVRAARAESLHKHFGGLLALGVHDAVADRLRSIVASSLTRRLTIEVSPDIVASLVSGDDDAYGLLALLVSLSADAAIVFAGEAEDHPAWLDDPRILPTVAEAGIANEAAGVAAVKALADPTLSDAIYTAARIIALRAPDAVNTAIGALPTATFNKELARAGAVMSKEGALTTAVAKLLDNGLFWAAAAFTSPLAGDDIAALHALTTTLANAGAFHIEPSPARAEAVLEAAAESGSAPALDFVAALVPRTMLKASFIRTMLTSLIAPRLISPLSQPGAAADERAAFARLAHALFVANTYVSAQPNFIEPLLPFYRGGLEEADRLVLAMFAAFESQRRLSVLSILRHWGGNSTGKALDALTALDPGRIFATCAAFPLRRSLVAGPQSDEDTLDAAGAITAVYDPAFVLPLLSGVLTEELAPLDWVELMRTNALGLALCALSSRDAGMRTLAGWILKRTLERVENVAFHEKLQLAHTLELVAHAIEPPAAEPEPAADAGPSATAVAVKLNQPRLPSLITLFLAHALRGIAHPEHFIYPLSSRFLLQRPVLDAFDVPMLYGMLYAAGDNGRRERTWIVKLLRDGVRSEADYRLLARRNTLSLLATLFASSIDGVFRRNILSAILSAARVPSGGRALLCAHVPWFAAQWDAAGTRPNAEAVRDGILAVLDEAAASSGLWSGAQKGSARAAAGIARFLAAAAPHAGPERLAVLARLALRIAPATVGALPALVARLDVLGPGTEREVADAITESLFRMSLYVPEGREHEYAVPLRALAARVAQLGEGTVGVWAREQARRA